MGVGVQLEELWSGEPPAAASLQAYVSGLRTAPATGVTALRSILAMALVEAGRAEDARGVLRRLAPRSKDDPAARPATALPPTGLRRVGERDQRVGGLLHRRSRAGARRPGRCTGRPRYRSRDRRSDGCAALVGPSP